MNNNKEKSDAVSELKSIKEVQEDFNKEKTKNNLIMLDTIPKLVCFAMVASVSIQVIGIIVLVIISKYQKIDLANIFSQITLTDIVSTGVAVIGIAVSVWVGLNIYLSLSREESKELINKMETEIDKIQECMKMEKKRAVIAKAKD